MSAVPRTPPLLEGVRVVDFTHVLSGPFATVMLAHMGADVVKIESRDGDTMRNYSGEKVADGIGPSFVSVNAGKRSIVLDLKQPDDVAVARQLIAQADVLVENFRPGVMARLGFGPEECHKWNPGLVFCSISGFGQTGPMRNSPALDQIIQSMSGLMTLSGEAGSPAMRVGFPLVDTTTGMLTAFAAACALFRRSQSGIGAVVDISMLDASLVTMMSVVGPFLAADIAPRQTGNLGYSSSPTADTFATRSGDLTLAIVRQEQFERLCMALGSEHLLRDTRYASRSERQRNGPSLKAELTQILMARTALEWERFLREKGLAAAAVRTLPEALSLDQVAHRAIVRRMPDANGESERIGLGAGIVVDGIMSAADRPPPRLGEHTKEILRELQIQRATVEPRTGEETP